MRIASVEGDRAQADLIRSAVESVGYQYVNFGMGGAFLRALRDEAFDLLILDDRLPDANGIELLQWVQRQVGNKVPVLFLTACSSDSHLVAALSSGADDYVIKPIQPAVLAARIQALIRRTYGRPKEDMDALRVGAYVFLRSARTVLLHGVPVKLTPKEFDIALHLFENLDKLVPRAAIARAAWGRAIGPDSRTLDTHMCRVRAKLAISQRNGARLMNVYGYGFRLVPTEVGECSYTSGSIDSV